MAPQTWAKVCLWESAGAVWAWCVRYPERGRRWFGNLLMHEVSPRVGTRRWAPGELTGVHCTNGESEAQNMSGSECMVEPGFEP